MRYEPRVLCGIRAVAAKAKQVIPSKSGKNTANLRNGHKRGHEIDCGSVSAPAMDCLESRM